MQWDEDWGYESVRQRRIDEEDQMNINYDEIITKANTRKNQLQKLTELLKQQPEMLEALRNVHEWSLMVSDCWAGLMKRGILCFRRGCERVYRPVL